MCQSDLQSVALGNAKKMIFQLYSILISIKQLIFQFFSHFHNNSHYFETVNYGTLLGYITVNLQLTSFCQSCNSFRGGLHSSSTLWTSWSNSGLYRFYASLQALWTLAV